MFNVELDKKPLLLSQVQEVQSLPEWKRDKYKALQDKLSSFSQTINIGEHFDQAEKDQMLALVNLAEEVEYEANTLFEDYSRMALKAGALKKAVETYKVDQLNTLYNQLRYLTSERLDALLGSDG